MTLLVSAAIDEGTEGDKIVVKTLEKLFYVFRFPIHTLFFAYMDGWIFFIGLFVNCLFYGFITERLVSFYRSKLVKAH